MKRSKNPAAEQVSVLRELWLDASTAYVLLVMQRVGGEFFIEDPQEGGAAIFASRNLKEVHQFLCEDEFVKAEISDALELT